MAHRSEYIILAMIQVRLLGWDQMAGIRSADLSRIGANPNGKTEGYDVP